jgi:hypothetical protein
MIGAEESQEWRYLPTDLFCQRTARMKVTGRRRGGWIRYLPHQGPHLAVASTSGSAIGTAC